MSNTDSVISKLSVGALVCKKNKVLLVKRAETEATLPGYWELPGGQVETGESTLSALTRMLKAETGLDLIQITQFAPGFSYPNNDGTKTYHINCYVTVSGEIRLNPAEHSQYQWVTKEQLVKLKPMTADIKQSILTSLRKAP